MKRSAKFKPRRGRPPSGSAMSAAERMRKMRARRKAQGFKSVASWVTQSAPVRAPYSSHRLLEARSLAMHAVIAQKIERDRALLAIPRNNLDRWRQRWADDPPAWFEEWQTILTWKWHDVAALITELSENATRLRQSSPFPGVLTAAERRRIYEAFRA